MFIPHNRYQQEKPDRRLPSSAGTLSPGPRSRVSWWALPSSIIEPVGESSNGTVLETRSALDGSHRPVPGARSAAQETFVRRTVAPAHARALRGTLDCR